MPLTNAYLHQRWNKSVWIWSRYSLILDKNCLTAIKINHCGAHCYIVKLKCNEWQVTNIIFTSYVYVMVNVKTSANKISTKTKIYKEQNYFFKSHKYWQKPVWTKHKKWVHSAESEIFNKETERWKKETEILNKEAVTLLSGTLHYLVQRPTVLYQWM